MRLLRGGDCVFTGFQYATLSHCWGTVAPLKLTKSSFPALRRGILISELPRTFADATTIVRSLHIRYLWVDSLCIFQDSEDDWRREATKMCDVYSNGAINIAASGAGNSAEGCFSDRNPSSTAPCRVRVEWTGEGPHDYFIQEQESMKWQLEKEPLLRRGWVVQERLLAPRVVYFGKREVLWQCREQFASEMWPEQVPSFLVNQHGRPNGLETNFMLSSSRDLHSDWFASLQDQQKIRSLWYMIVRFYSRCQLSFGKDKLIAISGIARYVARSLQGEYLAGLWRTADDLVFLDQLMWGGQSSKKRPEVYQAPSWSWCSVDCPVEVSEHDRARKGRRSTLAQIEAVKMALSGEDEYGQVTSGVLTVRCMLLPVRDMS